MIQRNSRLTALLVIGVLVICAPIAFAAGLFLDVRPAVDLGTIDARSFQGVTPQGGGAFIPLQSTGNKVRIRLSDGCPGSVGVLQVRLISYSEADITRFAWKGGDQLSYIAFPDRDTWMEVARINGRDWDHPFTMSYRYLPSVDDRPSTNYWVRLQFRLRLYVDGRWEQTIPAWVDLNWRTLSWLVIAAHGSIGLGTIDSTIFDIRDRFASLESFGNQVFVISNSPWELTLGVAEILTPPGFRGDLLANFYWQVDGGPFHSASGLDRAPVRVVSQTAGSRVFSFNFRYQVSTDDIPGDYAVTLRYTATVR